MRKLKAGQQGEKSTKQDLMVSVGISGKLNAVEGKLQFRIWTLRKRVQVDHI